MTDLKANANLNDDNLSFFEGLRVLDSILTGANGMSSALVKSIEHVRATGQAKQSLSSMVVNAIGASRYGHIGRTTTVLLLAHDEAILKGDEVEARRMRDILCRMTATMVLAIEQARDAAFNAQRNGLKDLTPVMQTAINLIAPDLSTPTSKLTEEEIRSMEELQDALVDSGHNPDSIGLQFEDGRLVYDPLGKKNFHRKQEAQQEPSLSAVKPTLN